MSSHVLEPAAQQIADATSQPPFLYELAPDVARKVLDDLQAGPIDKLEVHEQWITVPAAVGDVPVRIVKPVDAADAVLYVHGGGWVLGNAGTHDGLVRELAVGGQAAVVFVEYDRSPEARYPVGPATVISTNAGAHISTVNAGHLSLITRSNVVTNVIETAVDATT